MERWYRRQRNRREAKSQAPTTPARRRSPLALRMRSFGSPRLMALCRRLPRATVITWVVVLAVLTVSLMNLVVFLVLGLGADYGVHMVPRHREALGTGADEAAMNAALGETSKPSSSPA